MIRKCVFVIVIIFLPALLVAQEISETYVKEKNIQALDLNREGKFNQANKILDELMLLLNNNEAPEKYYAITLQTKAKVVQNLGNYEQSIKLARESLIISEKLRDSFNLADSYNTIGVNHYFLADYDSTGYYYQKSFEIKKEIKTNDHSLAVSAYNLAIVYEDLGQIDKALELYKEAENHLLQSGVTKSFLSDVYVGLAHINFYAGDIDKAENYAQKAMYEGIASYGEFNPNMTFVYVSYANILESKGDYDEAISLLQKSLDIRKKSYGQNHHWTCESHYDLANTYYLNGDYKQAEELYKKAIQIGGKIKSTKYLANAKMYLSRLYLDQEIKLDEAEKLLKEALTTNLNVYGELNEIVSDNYYFLGRLYLIQNDEKHFFKAIERSLTSVNYKNDSINQVIAPFHVLQSLELKREWFEADYAETRDLKSLEESYGIIDKEVAIIKYSQRNFSSDRSKIKMANEYRNVYESGLNLCWRLYQNTTDKQYLEKAFELSETNRNTTLLKGLEDIKFKLFAEIPEDQLDNEREVKKELEKVKMDLFYEKTSNEPNQKNMVHLLNTRIQLTNELDSIHHSFSLNYPKYKDFKLNEQAIQITDVQKKLGEEVQLVAYFLGEKDLYSFSITKDSVSFLKGDVTERLIDKTNAFITKLSKRENLEDLGHDLYLFLAKLQLDPTKNELIIIADHVLNYLPFEILQPKKDTYLIEDYCISYEGSARLFLELSNGFFDYENEQQWVGFSPEYADEQKLPSSVSEIREIQEIIGGVEFLGEKASKENFQNVSQQFSILHLAMHAEVNDLNSRYNKLIFADSDLTSSELYVTRNKANLAVLSACNTGYGKIEKGEGVMSMARAFHFSGIPSVVMSLWKVPDKETKSIMVGFYKHLKKGRKKSGALRQSKLDYLKSTQIKELRHPYYWSGFVVNGNVAPLFQKETDSPIIWIISLALLALIVGLGFKKFANR